MSRYDRDMSDLIILVKILPCRSQHVIQQMAYGITKASLKETLTLKDVSLLNVTAEQSWALIIGK